MCVYQKCVSGDCSLKFEVCLENPLYEIEVAERQICYALSVVNLTDGSHREDRHCFNDPHSNCPRECVPELHDAFNDGKETALYDCCCIEENLCNAVSFNFTGTNVAVKKVCHSKKF